MTKLKNHIIVLTILILCACANKKATKSNESTNIAFNNGIITDTLLAKIPLITDYQFRFLPESDDDIEKKLLELNEKQINYFYSSDEWKKYREERALSSFFYGKMPLKNGLLPILIIDTNRSSAVYLYYFLINKEGEITGKFSPTYIETSDYYLGGSGSFLNDSTYNLFEIAYTPLENNPNKEVKDSTFTQVRINYKGIIQNEKIAFKTDTIATE
jgi:hypothetical protein